MKKAIFAAILMLLMVQAVMAVSWDDLSPEDQKSMLKVKRTVTPIEDDFGGTIRSSTVSPLDISDPFAAAGVPVLVEFELSNVGEGFPLNTIPLPPDVFTLVMSVDREVGFRNANGAEIDVMSYMNSWQKFQWITSVGAEAIYSSTTQTIVEGRTCRFINVFNNLPSAVQKVVMDVNDGKVPEVFAWDCLKITDEPNFERTVKANCKDDAYSSECLAKINQRDANALTNTVMALLVSENQFVKETGVANPKKGDCSLIRSGNPISWLAKSTLMCNIGNEGIEPGKSIRFKFFIIVPADAPSAQPEELADGSDIVNGQTFQASCFSSDFPKQCHTIYAAVYPSSHSNLLKWIVDGAVDAVQVGGCTFQKLWRGSNTDWTDCISARTNKADIVGEPIYEEQGIFFVLGPDLDGSVTLTIWAFLINGGIAGLAISRKLTGG